MPADIHTDIVVATQHIKATPDVVFEYFTDPELIVKWLGLRANLDPQPNGVFFLDMGSVTVRGTYLSVEPPRRLVFSWGIPGDDRLPAGSSTVEVVLTPDGEDTMVVLTHRGLPSNQLEPHRAGWAERFGQLANAQR